MILTKNFILLISCVNLTLIKANNALNGDKKQDSKCLLPAETGPCRMSLTRFYYNAKTDSCEEFKFGGCKGNDNKFGFKATCEAACKRQPDAPSTATTTSVTETTLTNTKTVATTASTPKPPTAGTTAKVTSSTRKIASV